MQPGDVLDDRFELESRAGTGGMGEVFRARDRVTGELVAVKILLDGRAPEEARFDREAMALAELSHPGIVRYVAHGVTVTEKPYIAMEWLEGEELAQRIFRQRLTVGESITVIARTAEALAAAHARGVVHRDLKPSNLYLVHRDIERVKLLDFGIAKLGGRTRVTQTGMTLGTPGYMAPEQARSGQDIDARADIFALGCVLYECLTGAPVFTGEHFMAILAKILFEDAPRLRDIRPDVPRELDALINRMLAKKRDERPRDGAALAAELAAFSTDWHHIEPRSTADPDQAPLTELTGGERHLLSVVLMSGKRSNALVNETTLDESQARSMRDELRRAAEARGGRFEALADGSVVVTLSGTRIATDQAAQAARCALALRALSPGLPIALATGQGTVTGKLPAGEVIDRAARMLVRRIPTGTLADEPAESEAGPPTSLFSKPIAIDEVTAGLLDGRFEVTLGDDELWLDCERRIAEDTAVRTLLGKPTACVGRDRELAMLETLFAECVEEPMAQAVLVTGEAGIGKSRLVHELMRGVHHRNEIAEVWIGRGDSLRAGSAFGLLGQALRGACGIQDGEPLVARQEKLLARVARHVLPRDRARVAEFLGELMGTPLPDDESAPLWAARQDAELMVEQMRAAWEDFMLAETEARPVLLVLEDLHWGDLPTVRFVDAALRTLKDRPFMVLAAARPEVREIFPKLWAERRIQEVRLKELTRKASEKLVRQVLGANVDAETMERLVTQADGNAFYLEELIRAVAEGRGEALPPTVLAMVQARLEGLESDARRVLRAASVFGEVFWESGVVALLGGVGRSADAGQWLSTLIHREILTRRPSSRFPGQPELAFFHALLREGAYATLTEGDRVLGHRLAGEWLERVGEGDPMMLAEHFERGNDPTRAASFYLRAAEQAYRAGDSASAILRARRGVQCGVTGAVRLSLLGLICEISGWRNDHNWASCAPFAEEVMRLALPGSVPWCRAAIAKLSHAMRLGDIDAFIAMLDQVRAVDPAQGAAGIVANTLVLAVYLLDSRGRFDFAEVILRRMNEVVGPIAERDPIARGWMHIPRAYHELWVNEDPWTSLQRSEAARASFMEANHRRGVLVAQTFVGMSAWCIGALERAERELRAIPVADEELGVAASFRPFCLIGVLADLGKLHEARKEAELMIESGRARGLAIEEGRGRWALSDVLRRLGDLRSAEREALAAVDLLHEALLDRVAAMATLAAIQLAQGRPVEALATAEAVMSKHEALRAFGWKGAFARLIYAEALLATGEGEAASAALSAARERLLAQAAKISDPEMRRNFLWNVPENARTLELLGEWKSDGEFTPAEGGIMQGENAFDSE